MSGTTSGLLPGTGLHPGRGDERPLPPLPTLDQVLGVEPEDAQLSGEIVGLDAPRSDERIVLQSWDSIQTNLSRNADVPASPVEPSSLDDHYSAVQPEDGHSAVSPNHTPALLEALTSIERSTPRSHSSSASFQTQTRRFTPSPSSSHSAAQGNLPHAPSSNPNPSQTRNQPQHHQPYNEGNTEFVVPRWQPDVEATICPICGTQFSFFIRKHHCRKCGRVVCNSCSPHRIVIPYPYIVRPPMEIDYFASSSSQIRPRTDLSRTTSSAEVEGLGGGERVRLCNPCVPDPNVAPPQTVPSIDQDHTSLQNYHTRSVSATSTPYNNSLSASPNSSRTPLEDRLLNLPRRPRQPSILGNRGAHGPSYQGNQERSPRHEASGHRSRSSTLGNSQSSVYTNRVPNNPAIGTSQPQYHSLLPPNITDTSSRPLPPQPMTQPNPRHAEEDDCPVCHRELPSRALPDFEKLRENHIQSCIESFMASPSSGPPRHDQAHRQSSRGESSSTGMASGSQAPGSSPTSLGGNTPEARMAAREQAHAAVVFGAQFSPTPIRRTGIFPYIATEKDCVDDAECTICLEEFEVGAEMARLECFCRFHLKCIKEWFVTRPGQCPVHQHGAGY